VAITGDVYSHVLPGVEEAAALKFDEGLASTGNHSRLSRRSNSAQKVSTLSDLTT